MTDWEASTNDVRFRFAVQHGVWDDADEARFDRWLTEHDRVVSANAWEQGRVTGESIQRRRWSDEPNAPEPANPYRITEENK